MAGPNPTYTDEQRKEIAHLYSEGVPTGEIASRMGCSRWFVREVARGHGLLIRGRGNQLKADVSDQDIENMATRWQAGESQSVIAKDYGVSQAFVSDRLSGYEPPSLRKGLPRGENHPSWKGGRYQRPDGYVHVVMSRDHPFSGEMRKQNGYVSEHRLAMAEHLGRPLKHYEQVHHLNGDRADNRVENLQLVVVQPKGQAPRCEDCRSTNIGWTHV